MDGFNEKKWFVYLGDHHEGPFSLAEIQAKVAQSQVTKSNFVWMDGMPDWKPMSDVAEFEALLNTPASLPPVPPVNQSSASTSESEPEIVSSAPAELPAEPSLIIAIPTEEPAPVQEDRTSAFEMPPQAETPAATEIPVAKKPSSLRSVKWIVAALIPAGLAAAYFQGALDPVLKSPAVQAAERTVGDLTQPLLLKLTEKFPTLGKWISPLPSLEEVAPEEYELLKAAALAKLDTEGPKLAVALSNADLLSPSFYIASNLPDGTAVDLYIEGMGETLLNQLSFSTKLHATITKRLGKSGVMKFADGRAVPRGEYVVYATEASQQPDEVKSILANIPPMTAKVPATLPRGLKLLISKPYFLGGKKDALYESRLKEFHEKLRLKALGEITEVKQLAMTLDGQLSTSVSKFTQLRASARKGQPSPAARKAWSDFNKQWNNMNDQLKQSYAKWTPEALQNEFYYGVLYQLTQQAGAAIEQVHQLQQAFFEGKTDVRAFDMHLGTTMSSAQTAISALKTKLDQAEKLGTTANGMPRREGL